MILDEETYDPMADSKEAKIWKGLSDLLEVGFGERTSFNESDLKKVLEATAALKAQKLADAQLSARSLGLLAIEGEAATRRCAYVERALQRGVLVARLVALARGESRPSDWGDRSHLDGRKFDADLVWRVPTRLRYADAAWNGLYFVEGDMRSKKWINDAEFDVRLAQADRLYTRARVPRMA